MRELWRRAKEGAEQVWRPLGLVSVATTMLGLGIRETAGLLFDFDLYKTETGVPMLDEYFDYFDAMLLTAYRGGDELARFGLGGFILALVLRRISASVRLQKRQINTFK